MLHSLALRHLTLPPPALLTCSTFASFVYGIGDMVCKVHAVPACACMACMFWQILVWLLVLLHSSIKLAQHMTAIVAVLARLFYWLYHIARAVSCAEGRPCARGTPCARAGPVRGHAPCKGRPCAMAGPGEGRPRVRAGSGLGQAPCKGMPCARAGPGKGRP